MQAHGAATATIYVSPTGNDRSPGTHAAPLRSIEHAAKAARPGTEVVFEDGTYAGSVTTDVNGTADAPISFVSAHRGGARIIGDGSQDAAWQNNGGYVDIVGFDITGSNIDGLATDFGRLAVTLVGIWVLTSVVLPLASAADPTERPGLLPGLSARWKGRARTAAPT